jgi:hypothetical protein
MDLLSRINAHSYTDQDDDSEEENISSRPPLPIASSMSLLNLEEFSEDEVVDDSEFLTQMLQNLVQKSLDPSSGTEETDFLIESERWGVVHGVSRDTSWGSEHLTSLDFKPIEGVGGQRHSAAQAIYHNSHGGMVWADPENVPLPDPR